MYSAASQADFYCSGTWIALNSCSTSLPILYTQLLATQVKGKRPTAALSPERALPPRELPWFGSWSRNSIRWALPANVYKRSAVLRSMGW